MTPLKPCPTVHGGLRDQAPRSCHSGVCSVRCCAIYTPLASHSRSVVAGQVWTAAVHSHTAVSCQIPSASVLGPDRDGDGGTPPAVSRYRGLDNWSPGEVFGVAVASQSACDPALQATCHQGSLPGYVALQLLNLYPRTCACSGCEAARWPLLCENPGAGRGWVCAAVCKVTVVIIAEGHAADIGRLQSCIHCCGQQAD
jgi:hypothetical protein